MKSSIQRSFYVLAFFFTYFLFSTGAYADPPSRVGRLSYIQGAVSYAPADARNNVWINGRLNLPIVTGDRLWVDDRARAELQLGNASVRVEDETSLRVINLNDHIAQFDLSQGTLLLHVRNVKSGQVYEIDTPQLAFRITQNGDYRFDVDDNGQATTITVRHGQGTAYAKNAAYKIKGPQSYRFTGRNLQHQYLALRAPDSFERWSAQREQRTTSSRSTRYVSTSVIGYEDLDTYGSWRYVAGYGNVWSPRRVPANWAPYRYGHWSWVNPWGWTWIDDQPWGFAPSHYGRWAYYRNSWIWIPGPRTAQSTYAPALVAFVGGKNGGISISVGRREPDVAWFPLGPRDVYVPPYKVSRGYFTNINSNNTTINQVNIVNVYNNPTSQSYTNHQVRNAVTAVPKQTFIKAQPVAKATVPVSEALIKEAPIVSTATVAPTQQSVTGTNTATATQPPASTLERVPVVVTPPPAPTPSLAEQEKKLAENPGKPLDQKELEAIKPAETIKVEKITPPAEAAIPEVKPETPAPVVNTDAEQKAATEQADAAKATAEREAAEKIAAAAKEQTEKNAAEKMEAEHAAKVSAEREVAENAKAEQAAAAAKADAEREAAENIKAEKVAAAAEREAAENAKAEKAAAAAQANAEREAAEQAQAERAAKASAERDAADNARAEREAAAERASAEREAAEQARAEQAAAAERANAEREAAARAQEERAAAAERAAQEREAAQRAESERAAAAREEAARAAAEQRAAQEREAAQRAEAERAAAAAQAAAVQPTAEAPTE